MYRTTATTLVLAASIAGLALVACSTPAPEPEIRWARAGASAEELATERAACLEEATGATAANKRFDHIAKGSAFMRCMTERGWRQERADP
jgi:hypothetical protein